MIRTSLTLLVVAIVVASCNESANYSSIFRTQQLSDKGTAQATLIDAKQRALFTTPGVSGRFSDEREYIVCAEPSPDAVSSLSSAFSVSLQGSGSERIALAKALSEAVGKLGTRNATIQLLRDSLYRQCEAYMNGMIDGADYAHISGRYVDAMVTLLAIEQVTAPDSRENQLPSVTSDTTADAGASVQAAPEAAAPEAATPDESSVQEVARANGAAQASAASGDQEQRTTDSVSGGGVGAQPSATESATVDIGVAREVTRMLRTFLAKDARDRCMREMGFLIEEILYVDSESSDIDSDNLTKSIEILAQLCETIVGENLTITGADMPSQ